MQEPLFGCSRLAAAGEPDQTAREDRLLEKMAIEAQPRSYALVECLVQA
jgi:hypothetical protein